MKPVAVVGAGISGLTAAFRLKQLGYPVVVYEKQNRTGGVIHSQRERGFLAESGPTSIRNTALVTHLVSDLGLESLKVIAGANSKKRYLVRSGHLQKLPNSPFGAVTTPLLSLRAKIRLLAEPFVSSKGQGDQTLADFISKRLGKEILDYAVDPLVGGMYAGLPEKLSARYAFPKLYDLAHQSGSIFRGALSKGLRGKFAPKPVGPPFSFREGVQVLTDTLQAKLNGNIRTNVAVTALAEIPAGWRVADQNGLLADHSGVILAAPAPQVADMHFSTKADIDFAKLASVHYSGVIRVLFGFKRDQMNHPLEGFGFLVPRKECFHLLGSVFCSSVYAGAAPDDHVSFLCFLGGARQPELLDMDEATLTHIALRELRYLVGIEGAPVYSSYLKMPQAIPQYEMGHGLVCDLMDKAESCARGLFFAGNYRSGISVADALAAGWNAADRFAETALA
jgi:oxygen-dependent protoporphyrinogen oxidase